MGFRGEAFAFDSPAAAVAGMLDRLGCGAAKPSPVSPIRSVDVCPIDDAVGRILAEEVVADRDSPPFDYSAMDGYAVRCSDLARAFGAVSSIERVTLPVVGEARIGTKPPQMSDGDGVMRIATGVAIPSGTDAVIKREDVVEHTDGAGRPGAAASVAEVSISRVTGTTTRPGTNIRRRGENARVGAVVLDAGTVLSAAALGALAAVGKAHPGVFARLRVVIITTGDEVVPPETIPGEFQIRNSNTSALHAVLGARSWIEVIGTAHVRDDRIELSEALREATGHADAIVLSGGVSMGHRDPVRAAIDAEGGTVVFHGLPQRPGKPMLGAVVVRADGWRVPVFGLPGNPLSAMVTATRIVLPVLARLAGAVRWPSAPRVVLANSDGKTLDLWWHRLVRIDDDGAAELIDSRGSGDLVAGGRGDGFIEVIPGIGNGSGVQANYSFYPWPT